MSPAINLSLAKKAGVFLSENTVLALFSLFQKLKVKKIITGEDGG